MDHIRVLLGDASFWLLLVFISFVAVAARPVGRAVGQMLDQRTQSISRRIDEASQLLNQSWRLLETYTQDRDNSSSKAQKFLRETQEGISRLKVQAHNDFLAECARKNKTIALKVNLLEGVAIGEVQAKIAQAAVAATHILLKNGVTPQTQDTLVDEAIARIHTLDFSAQTSVAHNWKSA